MLNSVSAPIQALKLNKQKWEEAREHSERAVETDDEPRCWFPANLQEGAGLLFPCSFGVVDLEHPLGEQNPTALSLKFYI